MLPAIFFRCHNLKFCYGLKLRIVWKATVGLVQQGFCNSGAKLQGSTVVLRFNFCTKLKICASIAPPSQSPKTLVAILFDTLQQIEIFNCQP